MSTGRGRGIFIDLILTIPFVVFARGSARDENSRSLLLAERHLSLLAFDRFGKWMLGQLTDVMPLSFAREKEAEEQYCFAIADFRSERIIIVPIK